MKYSWTPERESRLARLWAAGVVARLIGKDLGFSKNAVVGKARRMKLGHRPSPINSYRSAHIDAVIVAYEGPPGRSMQQVADDLNTSATQVHNILKRNSPDSIRRRSAAGKNRPKPQPIEDGFHLKAMGLYRAGPCTDCGVPIVTTTPLQQLSRKPVCGFCAIARSAKAHEGPG